MAFDIFGNFYPYGAGKSNLEWPDRFIVQQFTGILDSNGIEIYEGDILRYRQKEAEREGRIDFIGTVEYKAPSFRIIPKDITYAKWYGSLPVEPNTGKVIEQTIIGNIFENQD